MKVRLTQIDGKLPNLALMKLAHWHRARGDQLYSSRHIDRGLFEPDYDRVYGSAIFSGSGLRVAEFRRAFPGAIVGGTFDLANTVTVVMPSSLSFAARVGASVWLAASVAAVDVSAQPSPNRVTRSMASRRQ